MHGAAAIAEILKKEGVEFLAAYPQSHLIDACAKVGIRPVLCRQERVGMGIADGFSRTTAGKRPAVFAMQHGPGAENAFGAAAQVFSDNVPILLIPGGERSERGGTSPIFSPVANYGNVTKWLARVDHGGRIPFLMSHAFYQMRSGKPGPVLLEVPHEVWMTEIEGDLEYTSLKGNKTAPASDEVREIAAVLLRADRPVIHAGQGCLYAEAREELIEISGLLKAPVMTTMPGKSAFPEDHPLSLGAATGSAPRPVYDFVASSDLIFGIGCSFSRTNYGLAIPAGKVVVHCTNDPADVGKDVRASHALIGDAKLALQGLIAVIKEQTGGAGRRETRDVEAEVQAGKKQWLDEWMPQLTSDETPINQYRVIWDLLHNVDRANTIVTHDAGSPREQVVPFWETVAPNTYMGWGKSTQLGHGLGLTMGAKLAEPEKLCINIMGDAAIGMVGMDIETAVRNKLGILTIVFNNGVMAIERNNMPYSLEAYGTLDQGGNYTGVAEALGAWGKRVEKPDDFIPALDQAVEVTKTGRPALLEVICKEGYDFSRY